MRESLPFVPLTSHFAVLTKSFQLTNDETKWKNLFFLQILFFPTGETATLCGDSAALQVGFNLPSHKTENGLLSSNGEAPSCDNIPTAS